MHLVAPLAAGIVGATSGTATIRKRGTGTDAPWWNTFEADQVQTGTVTLDGNGGVELYVNEYVDVTVYDLSGNVVREFTAGDASGNIEVVSPSFTGADYFTALSGANKPTTLQAVLDLVLASFGEPDFKVNVGGVATLLKDAVAGRQFFNVKDAVYGAKGDNATDDTVAIQAAMTAANAANGGWVFFPPGTYRITTPLTWYNTISLIGVGSKVSIITMDHASNDMFNAQSVVAPRTIVMGLQFTHSQANTGIIFDLTSTDRQHLFLDCMLGSVSLTQGALMDNPGTNSRIHFQSCTFQTKVSGLVVVEARIANCAFTMGQMAAGTNYLLRATGDIHVSACKFDLSLVAGGTAAGINVGSTKIAEITACQFTNSASTGTITSIISTGSAVTTITGCNFGAFSGTSTGVCVDAGNSGQVTVTGCTFSGTIGSTWTGIKVSGTQTMLSESGNSWADASITKATPAVAPYSYTLDPSVFGQLQLASRAAFRKIVTQSGGGTQTLLTDLYGNYLVTISDNTAFTLQLNKAPVGASCSVILYSSGGGGTGAIAWGANVYGNPGGGFTVATTKHRVFRFTSNFDRTGTTIYWFLDGTTFGDV